MSYPPTIQALIIEDEQQSKELYETIFGELRKKHSLATPQWAFCFNDGLKALAEERIFHLVIVDLRLPEQPGQPAPETLDFGISLLKECVNRDGFPIPALLIITGHLTQTKQQELDEYVRSSFAYGRVIAKSDHLEDEIEHVLQQIPRYLRVGIHIRDSGNKLFPTITPREEDLLRRCVLADGTSDGLDLAWWTANYNPHAGWVKVLMGRFLLEEGRGHSLYSFFKLAPAAGSDIVFRDAAVMTKKLKHVKVVHAETAGQRSLLVTQAAGSGVKPPLSLGDLFARPTEKVGPELPKIAAEIVEQVASLGDRTPDQKPTRQLLWGHHDKERIKGQWEARGGPAILAGHGIAVQSPIELFAVLSADESLLRYDVQSFLHGDLNYTNVAIDDDVRGISAFIFDGSGSQPGICSHDIAMLEVTALLHHDTEEEIVGPCAGLYSAEWESASVVPGSTGFQANTLAFIQSLRVACLKYVPIDIYALTVVDHALLQLGGLDFGSSYNKITHPNEACLLASLAARWYAIVRKP